MDIEWKVIPDYPNYEFSNTGLLRKVDNKQPLKLQRNRFYSVWDGKKQKCLSVKRLMLQLFSNELDDLPDEEWRSIPDYPNYEMSNYMRIRNATTKYIIHNMNVIKRGTPFHYRIEFEKIFPELVLINPIEEWKEIPGTNYSVSTLGNVKNNKHGYILKHGINCDGYHQVGLYINNKIYCFRVASLVAHAFIPNPNGLPEVNHIDEDKNNNCVSNLEWCSHRDNVNHATRNVRASNTKKQSFKKGLIGKPICQYDINNNLIKTYSCIKEAQNVFCPSSTAIYKCLKRHSKTAYGYIWKYAEEE